MQRPGRSPVAHSAVSTTAYIPDIFVRCLLSGGDKASEDNATYLKQVKQRYFIDECTGFVRGTEEPLRLMVSRIRDGDGNGSGATFSPLLSSSHIAVFFHVHTFLLFLKNLERLQNRRPQKRTRRSTKLRSIPTAVSSPKKHQRIATACPQRLAQQLQQFAVVCVCARARARSRTEQGGSNCILFLLRLKTKCRTKTSMKQFYTPTHFTKGSTAAQQKRSV